MDNVDVPAGHSMDSDWYAVDETGEVARFVTGEAGAFPTAAGIVNGEGSDDDGRAATLLQLAALSRRLELEPGLLDELKASAASQQAAETGPVLVVFDDPATPLNDEALVQVLRGRRLYAVTWAPMPGQRLAELRRSARAVIPDNAVSETDPGDVTIYEALDYDVPGAYQRTARPTVPLRVEDAPESVRPQLLKLKLPLRFADTDAFQLADMPSVGELITWGDVPPRGYTAEELARLAEKQTRKAALGRGGCVVASMVLLLATLLAMGAMWWANHG